MMEPTPEDDDLDDINIDDVPIEGSQWTMPWEWTPEQRRKAGIREDPERPLSPESRARVAAFKAKLDAR